MKKCLVFLSAVALTVLCGCSKWAGDPITKAFDIEGAYTELWVEDAFSITVSDTVDQVIITAGENVMPKVKVKTNGEKLEIYLKGWAYNRGKDMTVILPYNPDLRDVSLHGASDFRSAFPLVAQKVEVDLSGSSDLYCDIEAEEVDVELSGSSNIEGNIVASNLELDMSGSSDASLTGQVATMEIDLSGASTIKKVIVGNQYALSCNQCSGSMSGSSDAYIHCDGSIKVDLSGSSDLYYTGRASTSGCSTSGSSNIIHDVL